MSVTTAKRTSGIRTTANGGDDLVVGSRVIVNNELSGTIKFIGTTSFQTGKWVGVELDDGIGKNSGVVQGKRYFDCKNNHGVFIRPANVKLIETVMSFFVYISLHVC
jgi:dynactin complex subunit